MPLTFLDTSLAYASMPFLTVTWEPERLMPRWIRHTAPRQDIVTGAVLYSPNPAAAVKCSHCICSHDLLKHFHYADKKYVLDQTSLDRSERL